MVRRSNKSGTPQVALDPSHTKALTLLLCPGCLIDSDLDLPPSGIPLLELQVGAWRFSWMAISRKVASVNHPSLQIGVECLVADRRGRARSSPHPGG